jgi:protein phosphatase
MTFNDDETVENIPVYIPEDPIVASLIEEGEIEIGALTHRGRVRAKNEDQFAVVRRTRSSELMASSLDDQQLQVGSEQHAWLLAVADGLGGHTSGEIASATAIRTILNFAKGLSSWIMKPTDGQIRDDIAERVNLYAEAIQIELRQKAIDNPGLAGMATTLTCAYLFGTSAVVTNVGDSRSYLIRGRKSCQITRDHTVAQDMQDKGYPKEVTRPYQSIVTRTLTTAGDSVSVDMYHLQLLPGDLLLLCSDGLTDMVDDETIAQIASTASTAKDACEDLVSKALDGGGRDNITVVVYRMMPAN